MNYDPVNQSKRNTSIRYHMSQYVNGNIHCDEFVDRIYEIATMGVVRQVWYDIIDLKDTYREECRSVVSNFDKYGWDKSQLSRMASAYKAMKDAIDNECYPNVVEGTNL